MSCSSPFPENIVFKRLALQDGYMTVLKPLIKFREFTLEDYCCEYCGTSLIQLEWLTLGPTKIVLIRGYHTSVRNIYHFYGIWSFQTCAVSHFEDGEKRGSTVVELASCTYPPHSLYSSYSKVSWWKLVPHFFKPLASMLQHWNVFVTWKLNVKVHMHYSNYILNT